MDTPKSGQPPYNGRTACPLPTTVCMLELPKKGQPPNNGQNTRPQRVLCSEVPLYNSVFIFCVLCVCVCVCVCCVYLCTCRCVCIALQISPHLLAGWSTMLISPSDTFAAFDAPHPILLTTPLSEYTSPPPLSIPLGH